MWRFTYPFYVLHIPSPLIQLHAICICMSPLPPKCTSHPVLWWRPLQLGRGVDVARAGSGAVLAGSGAVLAGSGAVLAGSGAVLAGSGAVRPRINACSESLSHDLFFTCREENIFFYIKHSRHMYDIICMCGVYKCRKYPLTWNDGSLSKEMLLNFHLCWPHAQSQLPHFWFPCLASTAPFFCLLTQTYEYLRLQMT